MHENYSLEMLNIDKSFGGIHALKDVTFKLRNGEIHALVGENGAGKSTLVKILTGAYKKDKGIIKIDGEEVNIQNSLEGKKAGVGIIYQEFSLVPDLTVAENIFIGEEISGKHFFIKWKKIYEEADRILKDVGFQINPEAKVSNLSVAYQQMTEIAKTFIHETRVTVFDEPTSVLAPSEAEMLFDVIFQLKKRGVSIIYITHKMDEIFKISDRITVLKDGKIMGTVETKDTTVGQIINMMIGREISAMFPKRNNTPKEVIMEVKGLNRGSSVKEASFNVREGEILGIAGLVGAGKTEIARLIFGADKRDKGDIFIEGNKVRINNTKDAVKKGISYIPENRKEHGILLDTSVRINVTITDLSSYTNALGFINKKKEINKVQELIKQLVIKVRGTEALVNELSGGNQQKVSLAKWISLDSKVMIMDEPTRGVDVGAKVEIYKIIEQIAREGMAIIFISSEMIEIINMCDRVLVIHEGKIRGELSGNELTEENIMKLAVGQDS